MGSVTACSSPVHHLFITCSLSVLSYLLPVHHRVLYLFSTCSSPIHYLCIICSLPDHDLYLYIDSQPTRSGSAELDSAGLGRARLGRATPSSTRSGSAELDSAGLGRARLGRARPRLGRATPSSTRSGSAELDSTELDAVVLGGARPSRAQPSPTESCSAEPDRDALGRAEPGRRLSRIDLSRARLGQALLSQARPDSAEPSQAEAAPSTPLCTCYTLIRLVPLSTEHATVHLIYTCTLAVNLLYTYYTV